MGSVYHDHYIATVLQSAVAGLSCSAVSLLYLVCQCLRLSRYGFACRGNSFMALYGAAEMDNPTQKLLKKINVTHRMV